MERSEALANLHAFESIKYKANELIKKIEDIGVTKLKVKDPGYDYYFGEKRSFLLQLGRIENGLNDSALALLQSYEKSKKTLKIKIILSDIDIFDSMNARLTQLIVECDKAIGALTPLVKKPLSTEEMDKLNRYREIIAKIDDPHFQKNMDIAITAYEKECYLGSALISSRVIAWVLAKLEGKDIDEKISFLVSKGVIENRKDIKENIIKANKKARDHFVHRVDLYADASEALALLGDCVKVIEIYEKLRESISIEKSTLHWSTSKY